MVRRFKRDTRHFAKRQLTWFRKEPDIVWLSLEEDEPIARTAERVAACIDRFLLALEAGGAGLVTMGQAALGEESA
jgi:tRNA dimethylallyltransferase